MKIIVKIIIIKKLKLYNQVFGKRVNLNKSNKP